MTNEMKLLRAFIEAQGFEIEEVTTPLGDTEISDWNNKWRNANTSHIPPRPTLSIDYKVTKREKISRRKGKSQIHKIVREYESGMCSVSEMLNEIARMESAQNE